MEWKADRATAQMAVGKLLASYPQQAPVPEIYGAQLIDLCVGQPEALVAMMPTPEGILGECKFLPSVAEVKSWLTKRTAPTTFLAPREAPEHRLLPPPKDDKPEDSQEVKDAALARWKEKRRKLVANFHGGDDDKPSKLDWASQQTHDPEALLQALKNLEAHKQPHRQSA